MTITLTRVANDSVVDVPPPTSSGLTPYDIFVQVCIFASLSNVLCVLCIVLSSRHLYVNVRVSKMPLVASVAWSFSTIFLTAGNLAYGPHIGIYPLDWVGYTSDIVARSVLLWFTYCRTMTVWYEAWMLKYVAGVFQVALVSGWLYAAYEQRVDSLLVSQGDPSQFNLAFGIYSSSDLLITVIDILLIGRLWKLNRQMTQSPLGGQLELVKPLFFNFSLICMSLVIGISVMMTTLFITGLDPYYGYNGILFGFRILLTDIFSNLMRDSLIEAHAGNGKQQSLSSGTRSSLLASMS
ncbi:hypothetical protein BC831DRAFT_442891, partial [Entophlyctis helioformis]